MSRFVQHDAETSPSAAQPLIRGIERKFGFVPAPVALMATSPELLQGFVKSNELFEGTTLSALEREVLIMTVATRNSCHVCVAMHSSTLHRLGVDPEISGALRDETALPDARLESLRQFVLGVMDTAGSVPGPLLEDFLSAGYTQRNALEVVLGIGAFTMSTFANRMTEAPVDEPFAAMAPDLG